MARKPMTPRWNSERTARDTVGLRRYPQGSNSGRGYALHLSTVTVEKNQSTYLEADRSLMAPLGVIGVQSRTVNPEKNMRFITANGRFHVTSHGNGWAYEVTDQSTGASLWFQDQDAEQLQAESDDFENEDAIDQFFEHL